MVQGGGNMHIASEDSMYMTANANLLRGQVQWAGMCNSTQYVHLSLCVWFGMRVLKRLAFREKCCFPMPLELLVSVALISLSNLNFLQFVLRLCEALFRTDHAHLQ